MILPVNTETVIAQRDGRTQRRIIMNDHSTWATNRILLGFLLAAVVPIALSASLIRPPSASGLREVIELLPKQILPIVHLLSQSQNRSATSRDRVIPPSDQAEPGAGWG
jgi:hypothetical protein